MAQRQYPNDYNDRPDRVRDREREWRQGRNAEYRAHGWAPDTDRDSSLGEYYPTDNYNPDEEDFFDQSQLVGARHPRSLADNRQTGYGYGYAKHGYGYAKPGRMTSEQERGYREGRSRYGEERGESMDEGYGIAYGEAAIRRRAAMLEPSGAADSDYYYGSGEDRGEGSALRQGLGQSHQRHSARTERGRFNQGYAGAGHAGYNPDYQNHTEYSGTSGYGGQGEGGARNYPDTFANQPNFRGRGPKNYQRSDARIHDEICERLSDDSAVDASDIEVTVKEAVVHLEGQVDSRRMKHRAEDVVADCSGVKEIENRLRIAGAHSEQLST